MRREAQIILSSLFFDLGAKICPQKKKKKKIGYLKRFKLTQGVIKFLKI
jgi:hypothetical protein